MTSGPSAVDSIIRDGRLCKAGFDRGIGYGGASAKAQLLRKRHFYTISCFLAFHIDEAMADYTPWATKIESRLANSGLNSECRLCKSLD